MIKSFLIPASIALFATSAVAAPAVAAIAVDAAQSPATATISKGKMLTASDGARLAIVYRVTADGPQIILDGRMVTVPANTVSIADGKASTSLSKSQVLALR